MILFFSDCHLGLRSYSTIDSLGIYSSERDSMVALEYIYEKCKNPEISMIIFGGDITHSNQPTPIIVAYLIEWFKKMDSLNKPGYFITGNHDCAIFSHSMLFVKKLELKNIHLIDTLENSPSNITFGEYKIKFVPYQQAITSKNKNILVEENLKQAMAEAENKTIIVSHAVERGCVVGSESRLLSKKVQSIEAAEFQDKELILLLGHIHSCQQYVKGNIKVCYSGSTTYQDTTDLAQKKGFVIVSPSGEITLHEIPGIRKFIKYNVPENIDPLEYLQSIMTTKNSVVFLEYNYDGIDSNAIHKFFKERNCMVGTLKKTKIEKEKTLLEIKDSSKNMYDILKDSIIIYSEKNNLNETLKNNIIDVGLAKLQQTVGEKNASR